MFKPEEINFLMQRPQVIIMLKVYKNKKVRKAMC